MYARIENSNVVEWPILDIRKRLPNVSLPEIITPAVLPVGFVIVNPAPIPPYNPVTHEVSSGMPVFSNGQWVQGWTVTALPSDVAQANQTTAQNAIRKEITDAVMQMMDEFVATRNYSSMLSCVSYAQSTNPQFAAEAAYAISWRDDVWENCYQILSAVQNNLRPVPTVEQVLSELPVPTWPV